MVKGCAECMNFEGQGSRSYQTMQKSIFQSIYTLHVALFGFIFASQGFLIRTAPHGPLACRAVKSRDFCHGFDWGLLKPFDQSKMQNISYLIDNVFILFIQLVSVTQIALNPYFSSLSV